MSTVFDVTSLLGSLAESLFGVEGFQSTKITRPKSSRRRFDFLVPIGEKLEWLLGAFYADEDSRLVPEILAVDPATGAPVGLLIRTTHPTTFEEYAAFTNLTWKVTDRFDVQFGGRFSENKNSNTPVQIGPLVGGERVFEKMESKDDAFTYLVTPRFKISPSLMAYARLASGYRAGGVNLPNLPGAAANFPPDYQSDETRNYEVGLKGDVLDHAPAFDASLYYIEWQDIQLALFDPETGGGFRDNGGQAKSQGVELSVESRPLTRLTIAAWFAWSDVDLTEDFPPTSTVHGLSGDRLPHSSRFSGSLSLDQDSLLPAA